MNKVPLGHCMRVLTIPLSPCLQGPLINPLKQSQKGHMFAWSRWHVCHLKQPEGHEETPDSKSIPLLSCTSTCEHQEQPSSGTRLRVRRGCRSDTAAGQTCTAVGHGFVGTAMMQMQHRWFVCINTLTQQSWGAASLVCPTLSYITAMAPVWWQQNAVRRKILE